MRFSSFQPLSPFLQYIKQKTEGVFISKLLSLTASRCDIILNCLFFLLSTSPFLILFPFFFFFSSPHNRIFVNEKHTERGWQSEEINNEISSLFTACRISKRKKPPVKGKFFYFFFFLLWHSTIKAGILGRNFYCFSLFFATASPDDMKLSNFETFIETK